MHETLCRTDNMCLCIGENATANIGLLLVSELESK
jgi:hypothetical protein